MNVLRTMPHAGARTKQTDEEMFGAPGADQLLAQAQADLQVALLQWQPLASAFSAASQSTQVSACGGTLDDSWATRLRLASTYACQAASYAVQAAQQYAGRCTAAAQAASGAATCPGLYIGNEQAQYTPWGIIWNGQANCLDPTLVPQVGRQIQQAQVSVSAAAAAKNAACPLPAIRLRPLRMLGATDYISQAASLPGAGGSWANVQSTLQGEGLGTNDIQYAALSFVSAYQQFPLINPSGQVQDAVNAAAQFTLNNHSIGAAIGQVEGLVAAVASGANPQQVFQAFGGTLMATASLAVGAGAVSFGVGAAIVAGIGILESIVGFNQPTPPIAIVGSCPVQASTPPTIVDGYTWSWGQPTTSGPGLNGSVAPYWRRFPEPTNVNDAGWFAPFVPSVLGSEQVQWEWTSGGAQHTDTVYSCFAGFSETSKRPIDQIANEPQGPPAGVGGPSVYHQLEAETTWAKLALVSNPNDTLSRFSLAFFAAWKANREYGLNGLQQRSDAEVLAQVTRVWNRANGGASITISPSSAAPLSWDGGLGGPGMTLYAAIVLGAARGNMPNDVLDSSGNLPINGYAPKSPPVTVGGSLSAPSGSHTARNVAIGAGVVAAAGLGTAVVVAYRRRTTTTKVLKGAWQSTKNGTKRALRATRRAVRL